MHTSKIIEWNQQKGFGYVLHEKRKLFLHHRDFSERHKRPSKGDKVYYKVGTDLKGRRCAVEAVHVNDGGRITLLVCLSLIILMTVPVLSWTHFFLVRSPHLKFLSLFLIGINILTYFVYKSDKAQARAKAWRTSEASLHFLELIGGWPAALLAQRQFRHKCSKGSFQATYWLIVMLHIFLSFDYLLDWRLLGELIRG